MQYQEAASFLFDLRRFALRPGTDATRDLLATVGDPHEGLDCVQIAGSNGKGSTARMLESTLREAGLSVGLYTSPHFDDVRDRICVDGRPISRAATVEFVEAIEDDVVEKGARNDPPTFFETLTAMALWQFERQDVDVAVLEVGIGGSKDATSVVDPVASAVTSVSLEHTAILGDDVGTIARDKAAVAPADAPLVTSTTGEALAAVREAVGDVVTVGDAAAGGGVDSTDGGEDSLDVGGDPPDVAVTYEGRDGHEGVVSIATGDDALTVRLPVLGAHQATNAGVAATLARQVTDVDDETLGRGLRNAHWPGRFEVMGEDPLVVLDGAHNPGAMTSVAETLAEFDYDDLHVVVGAMVDKDHVGIARAVPDPAHVVACQPNVDRAETEAVVARAFEHETDAAVETRHDVAGAVDVAREAAGDGDCVLVTGSLYAVAEARRRYTRPIVPKRIDSITEATEVLESAHVTAAGTWRMRGKGVHRVLHTRLQPRQAQYAKEELLSLGGECAVSGVNAGPEELVDVVLMGTMAQFRRLLDKLEGQPYGLSSFATELRAALDIQTPDTEPRGYPWEDGTAIMGILNVTPDSFHDGGEYTAVEDAVARAEAMVEAGVEIVDVGGESTRPGAEEIQTEAEIDRVVPVVEAIRESDAGDATISIDTRKAAVARAALEAGADVLNDVSGLADPAMAHLAAEYDVPIVVMHSIDTPVDPGTEVHYDDVVTDVIDALAERVLQAERAGLDRDQILVDPGLGFGKTAAESFEALGRLGEFRALGCPILVGHSHKSMFSLVGAETGDRLAATVAGTAIAADRGADVIRVHDPVENVRAVRVAQAADDPTWFVDE